MSDGDYTRAAGLAGQPFDVLVMAALLAGDPVQARMLARLFPHLAAEVYNRRDVAACMAATSLTAAPGQVLDCGYPQPRRLPRLPVYHQWWWRSRG